MTIERYVLCKSTNVRKQPGKSSRRLAFLDPLHIAPVQARVELGGLSSCRQGSYG